MPSLPATHAVLASRQLMARNGRLVWASCCVQVAPPSVVRKMRPSSPAIQPSWSEAKHVAKRFCRMLPTSTDSAPATAVHARRSTAMTDFMQILPRDYCTRRADTNIVPYDQLLGFSPPRGEVSTP